MPFEKLLHPNIGLIFFQTLVMLCALFILKRYAWGPILAFIAKEETSYKEAKEQEQRARTTANALQEVSEGIIDKAKTKSKRIVDVAMATKAALVEEAKSEGMQEKSRLITEAHEAIKAQEEVSRLKLKQEVAFLVVKATQKLLGRSLEDQYKQEEFLNALIAEATKEQKTNP
jgi:F-type H+-transporting ATPase subunit b